VIRMRQQGVKGRYKYKRLKVLRGGTHNEGGRPDKSGCSDFSEENPLLRSDASSLSSISTTHLHMKLSHTLGGTRSLPPKLLSMMQHSTIFMRPILVPALKR
jgi:hypothetical protein